jgi:hypothetical protein
MQAAVDSTAAGLGVGGGDGLGLRRAALAEEDARTVRAATARNSLCQFCMDWNQNSELVTKLHSETGAPPCSSCWLNSAWPPKACRTKESRNRENRAIESECSYRVRTSPPRLTGPGTSSASRWSRGSASTSSPSGFLDSGDPFWISKAVSTT